MGRLDDASVAAVINMRYVEGEGSYPTIPHGLDGVRVTVLNSFLIIEDFTGNIISVETFMDTGDSFLIGVDWLTVLPHNWLFS